MDSRYHYTTLNHPIELGRVNKDETVRSRFDLYQEGEWPETTPSSQKIEAKSAD